MFLHMFMEKYQVRDGLDKGMQAIPAVNSIGFEASAGFNASAVNVTVAVSYKGRNLDVSIPADLTRPDQLPAAISKAFADAYANNERSGTLLMKCRILLTQL